MKKIAVFLIGVLLVSCLTGCGLQSSERVKLRDLEFTVLSEEKMPEELKEMIEERKVEPFKLTYSDNEYLYICVGYGEQETGGYSITVDELYLTDSAIYAQTTLLGTEASDKGNKVASYPVIVIKTELLDQTVICE